MADLRLDHVSVVVADLAPAIAFFTELGMELEGRTQVSGDWADRINRIDGVAVEIAMMRTPDGSGKLELTRFHAPALAAHDPATVPPNALGLRSVMFEVEDIDATISRLRPHGGELVG
ncbi:MAG TPA: VOC family protein, partial [Mycobacteriales bacterium]|nr:VOC family protein [Mycobacteriales bacterium]